VTQPAPSPVLDGHGSTRGPRTVVVSVVVFLAALLMGLPNLTAPEWEGTEARRAAIAEEMAWSGDWVVPTLGNQPTLAKPPLYYWLGALFVDGEGHLSPWRARLPGTLALAALAVLVLHVGTLVFTPRTGRFAALVLLTTPWFGMQLGSAEIDALFTALTGAAILLLVLTASVESPPALAMPGAGVLIGLALLTKGPPLLMFLVPLFLVRPRGWRSGRLAVLLLVAAAVMLPWLLAVWDRVGFAAFWSRAQAESVGRTATYSWRDAASVPLHLVASPLRLLPWLVLLPLVLRRGALRELGQRRFAVLLPIAAFAGAVLALCFFPARASRYLAPAVGPLALPLGLALDRFAGSARLPRWSPALPACGVVAGILLLAASAVQPMDALLPALASYSQTPGWWLCLVPPALLLCGILTALPHRPVPLALVAGAVAALLQFAWSWDLGRREAGLHRAWQPQVRAVLPRLPQEDVSFLGHVASQFLVALRPHPTQDEEVTAAPRTRWIVFEDTDARPGAMHEILGRHRSRARERLRLRMGNRSLVVAEIEPR
jgi:4-amino-4-deoxy-L-arabinose transferase-like glycosyltransferase